MKSFKNLLPSFLRCNLGTSVFNISLKKKSALKHQPAGQLPGYEDGNQLGA